MARTNIRSRVSEKTHEGAPAWGHQTPIQRLRRSVLSCLLWESEFYEDGESIAKRIQEAARACKPTDLAALAVEARSKYNLRHVPLLLLSVLAGTTKGALVSEVIEQTIQRADELAELLAVYAKVNGVTPDKVKKKLSAQMKKGLAKAFKKFDAYQLGKYNRDNTVKLRDVLFLCHAKPRDEEQAVVWKQLVNGTLPSPDTWEVSLSAGANKAEVFTRLLQESKLGYLALLRNLRNMTEAGVDIGLIKDAILARKGAGRVLPFRYIAAARACPQLERELDSALLASLTELPELPGTTLVLVDVSGSMDYRLSTKSDLTRIDAGTTLASIVRAEHLRVFTFSESLVEVPPRSGMAGVQTILQSQTHNGTYLGRAVAELNTIKHDRIIVVTDEQSHDRVPEPVAKRAYMINVGSYKNGVGYGRWTHINGFSENVLRFIYEIESTKE